MLHVASEGVQYLASSKTLNAAEANGEKHELGSIKEFFCGRFQKCITVFISCL
jgi:hypothetical protein